MYSVKCTVYNVQLYGEETLVRRGNIITERKPWYGEETVIRRGNISAERKHWCREETLVRRGNRGTVRKHWYGDWYKSCLVVLGPLSRTTESSPTVHCYGLNWCTVDPAPMELAGNLRVLSSAPQEEWH